MYKLNETKEKMKFLKKERTAFAFFILLCIPQVATRLLNIEEIRGGSNLIPLAVIEIITLVLIIVVASTLLYYLHTYHKIEY